MNEAAKLLKYKWMYFFALMGIICHDTCPDGNRLTIRTANGHSDALFVAIDPKTDDIGEQSEAIARMCGTDKAGFIASGAPTANRVCAYHAQHSQPHLTVPVPDWVIVEFGLEPRVAKDQGAKFYYKNDFSHKNFDEIITTGDWEMQGIETLRRTPESGYAHSYYALIEEAKLTASADNVKDLSDREVVEQIQYFYARFCYLRYLELVSPRLTGELLSLYEDYIRLATYNAAGAKPEFSEDAWHRILDNKVYANAYVQFYKTNIKSDFSDCWGRG